MRHRDLAGREVRAAANHGRIGNGVVRRSEGPPPDQASDRRGPGDRGDDGGHPGLLIVEGRQQSRDGPRKERLARSGRTDHYQAVAAGKGYLQCAPGLQLTPNLGQVRPASRAC